MDPSLEKMPPAAASAGCASLSPPAAAKFPCPPSSTMTAVPTATVAGGTLADGNSAPKTYAQKMATLDSFWAWKIGFRLLIFVGDSVAIGCLAPITGDHTLLDPAGTIYDDGPDLEPAFLLLLLIPVLVSLVWSTFYTIIKLCSLSSRPGHPGITVACDLVIWVALIITLAFSALSVDNISTTVGGKLQLVACIIQGVVAVLHFVLFVRACVDTSERNYSARKALTPANDARRLA